MASDATHANVVTAAGAITTAETPIGLIELPKREGGWIIHDIGGQVVTSAGSAAQFIGGNISLISPSGDIEPNPLPSLWPV